MTGRAPIADSSGFTLVELLVALSLMALIAGMTLGSFSFGRRVWEARIEREVEGDWEAARSLLRRQLSSAMPILDPAFPGERRIAFSGRSGSLEYVMSEPGNTMPPGLYRVRLDLAPDDVEGTRDRSLRLRFAALRQNANLVSASDDRSEPRTLLRRLAGLRFRYFGAAKPTDAAQWFDDWPPDRHLPELVELTLETSDLSISEPLIVQLMNR